MGGLTHAGVPEADAHAFAEGVRRGGALVTARVTDDRAPMARGILADDGRTVEIGRRSEAYQREGWTRSDEAAPPTPPTK